MAAVATTKINRYTNTVEYYGAAMTAVDDWFEVGAHSSEYTFAVLVTGGANFKLALECGCAESAAWFTIETSKTINSNGAYTYPYTGRASSRIRVRIEEISSGTPSVTPLIAVAYHG
jgi:hypothetical protein